ncbi:MAG: DUF2520 domain-containing protein [Cloacibacterium sp.]|jgi:predicted short-subunit dehydrogenase-like oxidoreductase (DUF2520 family)|nr:DUF2520 domain-containing protein [Cloacibacterium sp.]
MKIVIIGSGNVAYHLAKAFVQNEIEVSQIFGRNEKALHLISKEVQIPYSTENLADADIYLIAVNDNAIEEVSQKIRNKNCLVAHTSGSLPKEILQGEYRKASFYPFQTFSKIKKLHYSNIPFFIDAENPSDIDTLEKLALQISDKVMEVSYETRKYIHLTGVFACNFVNHLYAIAKETADSQNIPFQYFLPLIDETAQKVHYLDPKQAQTGPAVRNNQKVLQLHEKLIENKQYLKIYQVMTESIKEMYHL